MKKVVVTGAAGLIGSTVIDLLIKSKKYVVAGIDDLSYGTTDNFGENIHNPAFSFHEFDICDYKRTAVVTANADYIIHLAARKKIDESQPAKDMLVINTHGTESVLEAARINNCKVVLGSTSDVYGMSPNLPFNEGGDLLLGVSTAKRWSYAVSKLYDEHLAFAYAKDFGIPIVVLRYFGCFSEKSNFSWSGGHVPLFIDWILKDEEVIIHGDGKQTRSMGYVTDTAVGTILAMENNEAIGRIVNIGSDEELSVLDCAKLIHEIANTGNKLKIKFIPQEKIFGSYRDIQRRVPDLSLARRILSYEPETSLKDGLTKTIKYRKNVLGIN